MLPLQDPLSEVADRAHRSSHVDVLLAGDLPKTQPWNFQPSRLSAELAVFLHTGSETMSSSHHCSLPSPHVSPARVVPLEVLLEEDQLADSLVLPDSLMGESLEPSPVPTPCRVARIVLSLACTGLLPEQPSDGSLLH